MIVASPNKIIGALVYRTRDALNKDASFLENASQYKFIPDSMHDGKMSLWHYPGTPDEISGMLNFMDKNPNGNKLKFPAIFNYNTIRQSKSGQKVTLNYNLAIVGRVLNNWTTQQRETQLFDRLLRGIYKEFINQIKISGWFLTELPYPSHNYYEVFTTGGNQGILLEKKYGDFIDAIELHNLSLTLRTNLCEKDLKKIEEQNKLVTAGFKEILNK